MNLVEGKSVDVVSVAQVATHALRLSFSDGHESVVDFGPFLRRSLNPQTRQFLDRAKFRSYALTDGNVVWGDYDMCFSIEQLHTGCVGVAENPASMRPLTVAESRAAYGGRRSGKKKAGLR